MICADCTSSQLRLTSPVLLHFTCAWLESEYSATGLEPKYRAHPKASRISLSTKPPMIRQVRHGHDSSQRAWIDPESSTISTRTCGDAPGIRTKTINHLHDSRGHPILCAKQAPSLLPPPRHLLRSLAQLLLPHPPYLCRSILLSVMTKTTSRAMATSLHPQCHLMALIPA